MAVTATVDTRAFRNRAAIMRRNLGPARAQALRVQGSAVASFAMLHGPEDTRRWKRAIAMAANQAGAGPAGGQGRWSVPAVRPSQSRWTSFHVARLHKNLATAIRAYTYWQRLNRIYVLTRGSRTRANRTQEPYYRHVVRPKFNFWKRRIKTVRRQFEDYRRAQQDGEAVIFIGGSKRTREEIIAQQVLRAGDTGKITGTRTITANIGSRTDSIRVNSPGGEGRLETGRGESFLIMVNKEPHARFVQRNTKIMTRAYAHAKTSVGARRSTRKAYVRAAGAGTGWTSETGSGVGV